MHMIKLSTSDNETRWVNLDLVSRVTVGMEGARSDLILVVTFADGSADNRLTIRGSDDINRHVIDQFIAHLEEHTEHTVHAVEGGASV